MNAVVTEKVSSDNGHSPNVLALADQERKAKKSKNSQLLKEMGHGGVSIFNGIISNEEFNSELTGAKGIETYDKMRRTDAQVQALLYAVQLPVLAADWIIAPPDDEDEAKKVTDEHIDFVSDNLFSRIDFQAFLRHALSCLWAGYSWFEKVYVIEDGKWKLAKLSPRLASTLSKWWTDDNDNLIRVTQTIKPTRARNARSGNRKKEVDVDINSDKLVLFSFQQEGNNYEGMSLLRGAYKHWYIKDHIYRIDAIRHERFAIGIPHIELPEEWDTDDLANAEKIGKNWKGGAQAHVVTPQGWGINIIQMNNTALDVMQTIQHHNEEIAKAGLAQFINFGTTQTGTRSLGETATNFFYDALLSLTNWMSEVINRSIIWPQMDLNFPNQPRPVIKATDIGAISLSELMAALRIMGDTYITPDLELENRLRDLLNLPLKDAEKFEEDLERRGTIQPTHDELREEKKEDEDRAEEREVRREERGARRESDNPSQNPPQGAQRGRRGRVAASDLWREPSDLEVHMSLEEIGTVLDTSKNRIMHRIMNVRDAWVDLLEEHVRAALLTGRPVEIMDVDLGNMDERRMENNIRPVLQELFRFGEESVREELRSQAREVHGSVAFRDEGDAVGAVESLTIIQSRASDISKRLSRKTVETAHRMTLDVHRTKGTSFSEEDISEIVDAMTSSVEKEAQLMAIHNSSEAFNLGRGTTALALADQIEDAEFSSILDDRTCQPCNSMDGTRVKVGSERYNELSPPLLNCEGRGACRCMWVYRLKPNA